MPNRLAGRGPVLPSLLAVAALGLAPARAAAQYEPPTPIKVGRVTIAGFLQADALFTLDDAEDAITVPADTFAIVRARVGISGEFTSKLTWIVQGDFANVSNDARVLRDAFLTYAHNDHVAVRFGQFVGPFSLERLTSTTRLEVVDRSVIGTLLAPSRDFGLMVFNPKPLRGWLSYSAAIINGAGQNRADDNDAKDLVGRIAVVVPRVKGLTVGVNGQSGDQPEGARARAGIDVSYDREVYRVAFETVQQTLDYARRRETSGYSLLGAYHHKARQPSPHYAGYELGARYVNVDDEGFTLTHHVLQFGGGYFVTPQVRIQSNLVVPMDKEQPRHAVRWWSRLQWVF